MKVESSQGLKKITKNLEQSTTLESKLLSLAKQQPNRKTLDLVKFNLWVYDRFYTEKEKGWKHYLMTKIGEPYVLFDSTSMNSSAQLMRGYLVGKGFLNAKVTPTYKLKPKHTSFKLSAVTVYTVTPGSLFTIDTVFFPPDSSALNAILQSRKNETVLLRGDPFDADVISKEQVRILRQFQDNGYFNFRREDIYFLADTLLQDHKVNLYVKVDRDDTSGTQQIYHLKEIYLYPDYNPRFEVSAVKFDTLFENGFYFLTTRKFLDPDVLSESVFLQPGGLYSRSNYDCTLGRISDLGIYKFANVRFEQLPDNAMNTFIYLQPAKKHQISSELLVGNVEDNFASGLKLSYSSRNLAHRANRLDLSLTGGIQIPVFPNVNVDSVFYNVVGRVDYVLPRFAFPFINPGISCYNNPITRLSLSGSYYQQTNYYTLQNYGVSYSMEWKEVPFPLKKFVFPILGISYVFSTTTPLFETRLDQDPFLKQSFEKQFIMNIGGAYVYSNQQINRAINFTYLRVSLETAGNALQLFTKYIIHTPSDSSGSRSVFGVDFANYVRGDFDIRRYLSLSTSRTIVLHFAPGIAIPYGNSTVIPYVKQFYVGGTNSMRAWRVRSLGPGSFRDTSAIVYYSSAGDLKLEANIEYRYNILGLLKGAFFVDMGNIWTLRKDTLNPGNTFYFNSFYKQIGIGTGLGFRFDFTYFVLRFDVATKVYDPSLLSTGEDPWVIKKFCLYCDSDGDGKKEFGKDLLLQLAVGYPF